jgi:hypothetical protein
VGDEVPMTINNVRGAQIGRLESPVFMPEKVLLYEYGPNHSGRGRRHVYDGGVISPFDSSMRDASDFTKFGYLFPFRDFSLKHKSVAAFGNNRSIFIDAGAGAAELVIGEVIVRWGPFWRIVVVPTTTGVVEIKVFTPPTRYLGNDGMFPEAVEPSVHMLSQLCDSEKRERFLFHFNTGKWPSK